MAQPRAVTTSTLRPRAAVRKHWRRCLDASALSAMHRATRDERLSGTMAGTMAGAVAGAAPRESAAGAVVSGAWLGKNPSLPLATLLLRSRVALPVGPLLTAVPSPDAHRSQASHPKSSGGAGLQTQLSPWAGRGWGSSKPPAKAAYATCTYM